MSVRAFLLALAMAAVGGAGWLSATGARSESAAGEGVPAGAATTDTATFASGCFWCTQYDFDQLPGVISTTTGYIGGWTKHPTYYQVASGRTGHVEAVQVKFDPAKLSYGKLLDYYWRHADVLDGGGQFCDRGNEYRPVIFTYTKEQEQEAKASKAALEASRRFPRPIAVTIQPASEFTPAEPVHQRYYQHHQWRYVFYRLGCGRDARLEALWGKQTATN